MINICLYQYLFTMFSFYGFAICIGNLFFISFAEMLPTLKLNAGGQAMVYGPGPMRSGTRRAGEHSENSDMVPSHSSPGPMQKVDEILSLFFFGIIASGDRDSDSKNKPRNETDSLSDEDSFIQFPSGRLMHAELFLNKGGVHLPSADLLHAGHCRLAVTSDFAQTAVDAFAIILEGSIADVRALPGHYVLRSARTISMMKIPQEKLAVMWDVVLDGREPNTITCETLEMYRPLFKYLNGKQIARLNLTDSRIVYYIGTHAELNRRQVGVVAHKYIKMTPNWRAVKYLSNMNNLLCGVPMSFMRKIDEATYLRLEHQVFYHIKACDPLQRRFYLNMMTRPQALGKPFSWSARDVSRLGLLLAEVDGPALASISPEAMAGITTHIMAEIKPENMKYITDTQLKYISSKSKNILSRKLRRYELRMEDAASRPARNTLTLSLLLLLQYSQILIKQLN